MRILGEASEDPKDHVDQPLDIKAVKKIEKNLPKIADEVSNLEKKKAALLREAAIAAMATSKKAPSKIVEELLSKIDLVR